MYRQILVHPQDQNLQRILWRCSLGEPIQEYQLTTVTYGTASAPFLATRCLKKLADDNESEHPKAVKLIHNDFYVDDLLSSAPTPEEAIYLQQEVTSILQQPGFALRKWASNSSAFLDNSPEELREAAVKSIKYHLRHILGDNVCTYEELVTITANIQACLNSRPLCTLPNDPSYSYLSPGHFLIGEPLTRLPSPDLMWN
jgi:hypothetical protein